MSQTAAEYFKRILRPDYKYWRSDKYTHEKIILDYGCSIGNKANSNEQKVGSVYGSGVHVRWNVPDHDARVSNPHGEFTAHIPFQIEGPALAVILYSPE